MNLAKWRESTWEFRHEVAGKEYAHMLQSEWNKTEKAIVRSLRQVGLTFPPVITGYIVSPWKDITAFSDPLTIPIYENIDLAVVKIIHELIHIALSCEENKEIKKSIFDHINERFKDESYAVRTHIAVNLIQEWVMRSIPTLYLLLKEEKIVSEILYPGQKKAWHILKNLEVDQGVKDPIDTLRKL